MRYIFIIAFLFIASGIQAQELLSKDMAMSELKRSSSHKTWDYVAGLVARSFLLEYDMHQDDEWSKELYVWAKEYADEAIDSLGKFKDFKTGSLDNVASGTILYPLIRNEKAKNSQDGADNAKRYTEAANFLHSYLVMNHPRIKKKDGKGGFFHKSIYPNQMWLDGLYMGTVFYAQWVDSNDRKNSSAWSDIASQFLTIHSHTYNPVIGLNYHAWSADVQDANSFWARKEGRFRGCSPEFWSRSIGWYFAALVDVLEIMPQDQKCYGQIKQILSEVANGVKTWQDPSGCWYQLTIYDSATKSDEGKSNYLESSATSLFAYAYLKAIRLGLLSREEYLDTAKKAYEGLVRECIRRNDDGTVSICHVCKSAGLGPAKDMTRDGSINYYLSGRDVMETEDDGKAVGPFIMASLEYERFKSGK